MARARSIKPGLLKNEVLGVADPLYTLLFEGLWMLADRAGRLEDRPLRIKAEVFPYRDGIDCNAMLDWLQGNQFIVRYEVAGVRYIQILSFDKHQNPHKNEPASVIPAFDGATSDNGCTPSSNVDSTRADSLFIDSGLLTPSSLTPDSITTPIGVVRARPSDDHPPLALVSKAYDPPECPHQQVLALWAEVLPQLPQHDPKQWHATRQEHLRCRWREAAVENRWQSAAEGLEFFGRLFRYVGQSLFLTGREKQRGDRKPFVIELEWLIKASNWAKVIEGKYHGEAA